MKDSVVGEVWGKWDGDKRGGQRKRERGGEKK